MGFYKTRKEFKQWLEHFRIYDVKSPKIKVIKYGSGKIGRMELIRGGKASAFCVSKEYTIKAINKFIEKDLKEQQELPY